MDFLGWSIGGVFLGIIAGAAIVVSIAVNKIVLELSEIRNVLSQNKGGSQTGEATQHM
jgi:hypothetical protein